MKSLVFSISDTRTNENDESGDLLKKLLENEGISVLDKIIIKDDKKSIVEEFKKAISQKVDLIITTGGTGFSRRDVTPEATLEVIERRATGLEILLINHSLTKTKNAALSRLVCGLRDDTLIINLPGSKNAVMENMEVLAPLFPHAFRMMEGKKHE